MDRPSHLPILWSASAMSRRPSGTENVRRLAVDAVCRADDQALAVSLVNPRRTHVRVQVRDLGRDVGCDGEVRRDVVPRRVARLEYGVQLAEGEFSIGHEWLRGC